MSMLFEDAFKAIPPPEKAILDKLTAKYPQTTIEDVLSAVQEKRQYCLNTHLKFKRPGGKIVDLQDVFVKIATWLAKFREVGDVAVQYDPVHAALPWAALRFLLQAYINNTNSLASVAEGVEIVTKNYSRCALLEKALVRNSSTPSDIVKKLRTAIVAFYGATLVYLARASKFYQTNPTKRLLKNTLRATPALTSELESVRSKVDEVQLLVADVTAETVQDQKESIKNLSVQLASFEAPLKRWNPVIEKVNDQLLSEERSKTLDWICRITPRQHHERHFAEVAEGTGSWLQQKPAFVQWQNSSTPAVFWLRGGPGWGKTKLTSVFVQSMLADISSTSSQLSLAYFYCSSFNRDSSQCTSLDVIQSIVRQLSVSTHSGAIHQEVQDLYHTRLKESHAEGLPPKSPTADESIGLILRMTKSSAVTIIVDGLDELGQDMFILTRAIRRLVEEASLLIKIFVTSRSIEIDDFDSLQPMLCVMHPDDNEADIRRFLHQRTSIAIKEKRLLDGKVSSATETRIVREVSQGANGMFLWASLQLRNICDNSRFALEHDVLRSLAELPKGLAETFSNIVNRILQYEPAARTLACTAISWLLVAKRPLTMGELLAACATYINEGSNCLVPDKKQLLALCHNLVVLDRDESVFRFLHASVHEYLYTRPEFSAVEMHKNVLERCLASYTTDLDEVIAENSGIKQSGALRRYACWYWMEHYQAIQNDDKLSIADEEIQAFVSGAEGLYFALWLNEIEESLAEELTSNPRSQRLRAVLSTRRSPVHAAAAYDIPCILERYRDEDSNHDFHDIVNEPNLDGAGAVYTCARNGSNATLRHILNKGGQANATGGHIGNALQAAAFWGYTACVELLLEYGADHEATGRFPNSLAAAIAGGNEDTAMVFVRKRLYNQGEVVHILDTAASRGFDIVIKALSQQITSPDLDAEYEYLEKALAHGSLQATKYWISRVSDLNASKGHYGNAMQAAAFGGNEKCISLLLDAGVSVDTVGLYGSALRAAVLQGNHKAVDCLLNHGAQDETALIAAAQNGRLSIIQILLDAMETNSAMPKLYSKALDAASRSGQHLVVDVLLTRCGAGTYSSVEQQALHEALFIGNSAVLGMFVKHYPSMRGISQVCLVPQSLGRGPRVAYDLKPLNSIKPISEYIDEVFAASFGCSPGGKVDGGNTMRLAARSGHTTIIETLLSTGHSVHGNEDVDTHSPSALPIEVAAAYGQVAALDILLGHGSILGRSLVFATRFGHMDVIKYILRHHPESEVDLEYEDFAKSYAEELQSRHSSSADFSNHSALGLAIDLDNNDIFELLLDHKMRSERPVPNISLLRAVENGRAHYMQTILKESPRWRLSKDSTQSHHNESRSEPRARSRMRSRYERRMENGRTPLKDATEDWFKLLGHRGSTISTETTKSELTTVIETVVKAALSREAYNTVKLLIEFESDSLIRDKLIYSAATLAGSLEHFSLPTFLGVCCMDGTAAALLTEIILLNALQPKDTYGSRKSCAGETHLLKISEILKYMRKLFADDVRRLDTSLARLCHRAITRQRPLLTYRILNESSVARQPLGHKSDILHDLLDAICSLPASEKAHLPSLFELLSRYGADLESERGQSVLVRVCTMGLADCLFFMVGRGVPMPDPTEAFTMPTRFPQTSHGNPVNLLSLTIRGYLESKESSRTPWQGSLSPGYGNIVYFLWNCGFQNSLRDPEICEFCQIVCYQNNEPLLTQILQIARDTMGDDFGKSLDELGLLHAAVLGGHWQLVGDLTKQDASTTHSVAWSFPSEGSHPEMGTPAQVATHKSLHKGLCPDSRNMIMALENLSRRGISDVDSQRVFGYAMNEVVKEVDYDPCQSRGSAESLVRTLLQEDVDVTAADIENPYLASTVQYHRKSWLTYLFDKGLDLGSSSERLLHLLQVATEHEHVDIVELLMARSSSAISKSALDPFLDSAIERGNDALVAILKHDTYDINRIQEVRYARVKYHTLLGKQCSAFDADPVVIRRLLQHGADANLVNEGWTPLTILLQSQKLAIDVSQTKLCIEALLEHGCNVNTPREIQFQGQTVFDYPIHMAMAHLNLSQFRVGHAECMEIPKLLIEAGADTSVEGGFGTPLFQARWLSTDYAAALLSLAPTAVDKPGKFSFTTKNDKPGVRRRPTSTYVVSVKDDEDLDIPVLVSQETV